MRDDRNGGANGRPAPRVNGVLSLAGAYSRAGSSDSEPAAPVDLVAVQADDELVNAVGSRADRPTQSGRARKRASTVEPSISSAAWICSSSSRSTSTTMAPRNRLLPRPLTST